jgi:hypothetical protein
VRVRLPHQLHVRELYRKKKDYKDSPDFKAKSTYQDFRTEREVDFAKIKSEYNLVRKDGKTNFVKKPVVATGTDTPASSGKDEKIPEKNSEEILAEQTKNLKANINKMIAKGELKADGTVETENNEGVETAIDDKTKILSSKISSSALDETIKMAEKSNVEIEDEEK